MTGKSVGRANSHSIKFATPRRPICTCARALTLVLLSLPFPSPCLFPFLFLSLFLSFCISLSLSCPFARSLYFSENITRPPEFSRKYAYWKRPPTSSVRPFHFSRRIDVGAPGRLAQIANLKALFRRYVVDTAAYVFPRHPHLRARAHVSERANERAATARCFSRFAANDGSGKMNPALSRPLSMSRCAGNVIEICRATSALIHTTVRESARNSVSIISFSNYAAGVIFRACYSRDNGN